MLSYNFKYVNVFVHNVYVIASDPPARLAEAIAKRVGGARGNPELIAIDAGLLRRFFWSLLAMTKTANF